MSRTTERSESSKASAHASSDVDSKVPGGGPPALLTTISSRPRAATVSSTSRSSSAASRTSPAMGIAPGTRAADA